MSGQQKRDTNQEKGSVRKRSTIEPAGQEFEVLDQSLEPGALQRAVEEPGAASPADILALQRNYGNKATSNLIQAKLTVGAVGDHYEQEADRVAEQVTSMSDPVRQQAPVGTGRSDVQRQDEEEELQAKPLAPSITPLVQRQEEEEELQMKPLVQRQEEEEELQMKPLVQRQEEEEELQMKPLVQRQEEEEELQMKPLVQRQEEEEELQMKPLAASITPLVQRQEEEEELQMKPSLQRQEEEEELQMRSGEGLQAAAVQKDGSFQASSGVEDRLAAEKGGGSPLPDQVRSYMEPRFGADFSGVRVHTGSTASQLNRDLGSKAFTHGQDLYFRGGAYEPESSSGQELLAHELTHTVQQGGAQRIQTWGPTGHRLVSEAAFQDENLSKTFGDDAKKLVIDRAPDVDGIQDQFTSMMDGIDQGKGKINQYEAYIKGGDTESAKRMWENNELHFRPPPYMLSHGEGGQYKQEHGAAATINEAMTRKMIDNASDAWSWDDFGKRATSLAKLSDAVHQAEDRGSHQEGEQFKGHDVRLGVFKWREDQERPMQSWETLPGAPPLALEGKWDPDNASKNAKGAVLGVAFAQGALRKFVSNIREKESEKGYQKEYVFLHDVGTTPDVRHVSPVGSYRLAIRPGSWLGKGIGKTAKGWTKRKKRKTLNKILTRGKEGMLATGQLTQEELDQAGKAPEIGELGEGEAERLEKGVQFYETGAGFNETFKEAEEQFRNWRKPRIMGGLKKKKRILEAKAYFVKKANPVKDDPGQLSQIADSILKAYTQVFKVRLYPTGQVPYVDGV